MAQTAELAEIEARLSNKAGVYFPELSDSAATFYFAGVSRRSYSTVYFFQVSSNRGAGSPKQGIAVKLFSKRREDEANAKSQFAALLSAWPAFHDAEMLAIPRPLEFFTDLPALVMERVRGESLQEILKKSALLPGRRSASAAGCKRSGQWLRHFHDATWLQPGRLDVAEKLRHAQASLAGFAALGFPAELCRQISTSLETRARSLSDIDMAMATVHGDFTVDNVLLDGARITALDISGKDRNAIYHDVATFLNSLCLIRMSWPVSRSLVKNCGHAFLAGYFNGEESALGALAFLRLTGLISSALEILGRRWRQPLARLWVRRFFIHQLGGMARS